MNDFMPEVYNENILQKKNEKIKKMMSCPTISGYYKKKKKKNQPKK